MRMSLPVMKSSSGPISRAATVLTFSGVPPRAFKGLQLVSAAAVSFGHGANDAQKTMGIMAASLYTGGYLALKPDGNL